MDNEISADGGQRLQRYLDSVGQLLGSDEARSSFAVYSIGLLGAAERKSVEPIAALACPDPQRVDAAHQRLLHFLSNVPWSDHAVRLFAARHAIAALTTQAPIESWIIDDTGLLKQGNHSVGVQRQYTGSAGKVTNCQVAVSLSVATRCGHTPVDIELYLPERWANIKKRRKEARIPDDVVFRTKPDIALDIMRRAIADGIPLGVVLADAAYGNSAAWRVSVRQLGLHYAVGVDATTKVYRLDKKDRIACPATDVRAIASINAITKGSFHRVTWRQGTNHRLSARFSFQRVIPAHDDGTPKDDREVVWLICEWRSGEQHPTKYHLVSLPSLPSMRETVRILKERWRTERVYQDLKGEVGFDHFEGRRFTGWNHHVSVALSSFAFLVAERVAASSTSIPPCAPLFTSTAHRHSLHVTP